MLQDKVWLTTVETTR